MLDRGMGRDLLDPSVWRQPNALIPGELKERGSCCSLGLLQAFPFHQWKSTYSEKGTCMKDQLVISLDKIQASAGGQASHSSRAAATVTGSRSLEQKWGHAQWPLSVPAQLLGLHLLPPTP